MTMNKAKMEHLHHKAKITGRTRTRIAQVMNRVNLTMNRAFMEVIK